MSAPTAGPPWILGRRGVPLEAPENTRAGLALAFALGLDGAACDVRAARGGELVLHADAGLERTTDGTGRIAGRSWLELADLDAGGAFHARFRGEPLLLLHEALEIARASGRALPLLLEFHEPGAAAAAAPLLREFLPRAGARALAGERALVLEARDAGLAACASVPALDERTREAVRADRLTGLFAPIAAWQGPLGREDWPVERWAADVDAPADLLAACRAPLHGFTTREPRRALAARELTRLAAQDRGGWPVGVAPLEVRPEDAGPRAGQWWGSWAVEARVRNPFGHPVRAACALVLRRGAFDVDGLPAALELAPGAEEGVRFTLTGGAWRPGGDPLLVVRYAWRAGPGRPAGSLDLDAPLARVRSAVAGRDRARLALLRESPRDAAATMLLQRRGRSLLVSIESAGGLAEPRVAVRLGGAVLHGARGVRVELPEDFDAQPAGVPFSCGIQGRRDGETQWRRWAGGLPDEADAGAPGILLPTPRA